MQFQRAALTVFSVMALLAAWSGVAAASGFALMTQSGSGLGNAYAGAAASAENASTIFFNPAGMARLHGKQLVLAAHLIGVSSQFSDTGSLPSQTGNLGTVSNSGRRLVWIPNGYFATEITPRLHFGTGINTPFGSSTEYQSDWIGRYQAIKSSLETVNVNPSVSWQATDALAIGAGANYQRIKGNFSSALNYAAGVYGAVLGATASPALAGAASTAATNAGQGEGATAMSGSDAAWGYNLGLLFDASPQTRVGLAYRSTIKYNLSGSVSFSANRPTAATLTPALAPLGGAAAPTAAAIANGVAASSADGAVNLAINMPDSFSAGVFHQLNDKWDIMADATWTGWKVFDQLKIIRASGATLSLTPENWKNTWRVALGVNHHYNEQWTVRVGMAYDQSPVPDAFRTARLPDADRTMLSLGGQCKLSKESVLDFGYAHLFVKQSSIDRNRGGVDVASTTLYARLAGNNDSKADILSVQYNYGF